MAFRPLLSPRCFDTFKIFQIGVSKQISRLRSKSHTLQARTFYSEVHGSLSRADLLEVMGPEQIASAINCLKNMDQSVRVQVVQLNHDPQVPTAKLRSPGTNSTNHSGWIRVLWSNMACKVATVAAGHPRGPCCLVDFVLQCVNSKTNNTLVLDGSSFNHQTSNIILHSSFIVPIKPFLQPARTLPRHPA